MKWRQSVKVLGGQQNLEEADLMGQQEDELKQSVQRRPISTPFSGSDSVNMSFKHW